MIREKFIAIVAVVCACSAVSSLNAATIPAGTTLGVQTVSSISSKDAVGRTFEARLDQDVDVKGKVLLKAGTKAFGKIKSSRANPRKSEPLTLELTSISVNGREVAVERTAFSREARRGRRDRRGMDIRLAHWLLARPPKCNSNFCKLSAFRSWFVFLEVESCLLK